MKLKNWKCRQADPHLVAGVELRQQGSRCLCTREQLGAGTGFQNSIAQLVAAQKGVFIGVPGLGALLGNFG